MTRMIIGFTGKMGSGKSTAAKALGPCGFSRVRFAETLKDMMRCIGLNERQIEGDLKETPCELLGGKTPRFAMQTIGTEWGRDTIDKNLWINAWKHKVEACPPSFDIVVDDVRFPNEAKAVRALGGIVVRIESARDSQEVTHASEVMDIEADVIIRNDGSIWELEQSIHSLLSSNHMKKAV